MTDDTSTARRLIRNAVLTMVRESGGQVTRIPRGEPGAGWTEDAAGPLEGIAAARQLEHAAAGHWRNLARDARASGKSWQQIGEALACQGDPEHGITPAREAFRVLAPDYGTGRSFGYTCGTCGHLVIDRGPECGHPEDQERGHAERCARFAATVAAWEEQWGDD